MSIFFTGSYTQMLSAEIIGVGDGIYTVYLNDKTGEIKVLHILKTINPSYLCISDDRKYLYCNTELSQREDPKIQAYKIRDDFSLEFLNEKKIKGGYPCHIMTFQHQILSACYETGNVFQYSVSQNGKLINCVAVHQHYGSSIHKERQEAPHAHQIVVRPNKNEIYVCDLGIDLIKAYRFQQSRIVPAIDLDVSISKGAGPRHMVFNRAGDLAYVLNELNGMVSLLKSDENEFHQIRTYDSLPTDFKGVPSASAIRIHPNGSYLYAANRTLDAITIFRIDQDELVLIDYTLTQGKELREFNISPDGQWLITCHQNSNDIVVYRIQTDGKLIEIQRNKEIKTPVCLVFL